MTTTHDQTTAPAPTAAGGAGIRLACGSALLFLGVALEWLLNPQRGDGTVLHPARFALCVGTSVVGAALLAWGLRELRGFVPGTRGARFGRATTAAGAVLLMVSMAAILGTGIATGTPAGISFVPWGLGMLALSVGPVVLGASVLGLHRAFGVSTMVAGVAALGSVVIPVDPWHDVSLATMCAAWVAAGLAVRR
jgi:hypothetical protein